MGSLSTYKEMLGLILWKKKWNMTVVYEMKWVNHQGYLEELCDKFCKQMEIVKYGLMVVGLLQSNAQLPDVHSLWKLIENHSFLKIATAFCICTYIHVQEMYVGANAI